MWGNGGSAACGEEEKRTAVNNPAPWPDRPRRGRRRGRARGDLPGGAGRNRR